MSKTTPTPTPTPPTIRDLRDQAHLTPADVERITDGAVKRGALSAIERGLVPTPRYATLTRLAQALGVDPDECQAAVHATVAARQSHRLTRGSPGRPKAAPMTLAAALQQARQLCAALEVLAAAPGR